MRNLDHAPGFWLTVLLLLPFMLAVEAVEILCQIEDAWDTSRKKRTT